MKRFYYVVGVMAMFLSFSCSYVPESYEGVLVTNCGQNGMDDYKIVVGRVNDWGTCTYLRSVPMFEFNFDMQPFKVTTSDGGNYTVDPSFTFKAIRGKSREIVFNYNNLIDNDNFLQEVAANKLSYIVQNAYVEEARNYKTDSLMRSVAAYEKAIEERIKNEFKNAYFEILYITGNVTPPSSIASAVEARDRMNLEQQSIKIAFEKAQKQAELDLLNAETALKVARIEAQTNLEKAKGLNEMLLRELMIKGWVENKCPMPTTVSNFPMWNSLMQPMTKQ